MFPHGESGFRSKKAAADLSHTLNTPSSGGRPGLNEVALQLCRRNAFGEHPPRSLLSAEREITVGPHPFRGRGRCWFPPQGRFLAPPGSGGGGGGAGSSAEPKGLVHPRQHGVPRARAGVYSAVRKHGPLCCGQRVRANIRIIRMWTCHRREGKCSTWCGVSRCNRASRRQPLPSRARA